MSDMFEMVSAIANPTPKPERWKSVGDRAMVKGKYTICQYGYKPNEDYALFGSGPQSLGNAKTYQELMEKVEEFDDQ